MARSGRGVVPRTPSYPTYTPPPRSSGQDTYDSYEAERNKSFKSVQYYFLRYGILLTSLIERPLQKVKVCN